MTQVISDINKHSLEQLASIEKYSRDAMADNRTDRRVNFMLISELAQHGSHLFPAFAEFVAGYEDHPRAVAFLDMNRSVYQQTSAALHAPGAIFDDGIRKELYHPQNPVYFGSRDGRQPLVVVFTTAYNNFYISNPVFAEMLARAGYSFLFLKDPTGYQYLRGIAGISPDWHSSITWLNNFLAEKKGDKKVVVTGFSSSGYSSILAAIDIQPDLAIGFSINSTMNRDRGLPAPKVLTPDIHANIPDALKTDLVTELKGHSFPLHLYFGALSHRDKTHAIRFADLEQAEIFQIQEESHNCFRPLLQNGHFISLFST